MRVDADIWPQAVIRLDKYSAAMSPYLRLFIVFATAAALCITVVSSSFAQTVKQMEPTLVNGNNNETTKAELDQLATNAGNNKLIIMIARLGRSEFSRRLSQRRLQTLSSYLETVRAIPKQQIVKAEGGPIQGPGRVEVYLEGKLYMIFTLARNKNFAQEP